MCQPFVYMLYIQDKTDKTPHLPEAYILVRETDKTGQINV